MRDKNPKRKKLHWPLWPISTPIKPNIKRQEEIQQEGIVERKEVRVVGDPTAEHGGG